MTKSKDKSTMLLASVTGTCKWASIIKPNTKFEPQWCIDVVVDETKAAKMEKAGLKIKKDTDGDLILKVKRAVTKRNGEAAKPPTVVDADGMQVEELVGNGSTVTVDFGMFEWEGFGTKGMSTYLNKVTVLNLIPYTSKGDSISFDDDSDKKSASEIDFDVDVPF